MAFVSSSSHADFVRLHETGHINFDSRRPPTTTGADLAPFPVPRTCSDAVTPVHVGGGGLTARRSRSTGRSKKVSDTIDEQLQEEEIVALKRIIVARNPEIGDWMAVTERKWEKIAADAKRDVADTIYKLESRIVQHEKSDVSYVQKISQLKDSNADFKQSLADMKKEIANLKAEVAEIRLDNAELKVENGQWKEDITKLKEEITKLKDKNVVLECEIVELKEKDRMLERENGLRKGEIIDLKIENQKCKADNDQLQSEIRKVKDDNACLQKRVAELERKVEMMKRKQGAVKEIVDEDWTHSSGSEDSGNN